MTTASGAKTTVRPLGDRVLVKPLPRDEVTKSGIVLPDTAKEKPQEGLVIAVGTGRRLDSGELDPLPVKAGDRVLYGKYAGTEIKLDNEDHLILRENDLLAVLAS